MKKLFLFFAIAFMFRAAAQDKPVYDSALAKKLGADDYGMKHYVMAFLKPGSTKIDSAQRSVLMAGHLKNIGRLAREGKLLLAGPFLDRGPFSGIFIFDVTTVEEAKALVSTDPAVQAGMFTMELHPWYGSAALMQVVPQHAKLQKTSLVD